MSLKSTERRSGTLRTARSGDSADFADSDRDDRTYAEGLRPPLAGETDELARILSPVRDELAEVERTLDRELCSEHPFLHELSRYGAYFGGKRLRPTLLLLAGKASGELVPAHVVAASAIEMIHAATLVHDDLLDDATTRRRLPTVNVRWNGEVAVLMGDYLFSHAFRLAASTGSAEACRIIGAATNATCAGELKQVASRGDLQLSEADYYEIVEGKTAALLACCGRLGAELAGADRTVIVALESFGRDLGIVFQIVDDLLDVCGDAKTMGKETLADLAKGKLTLPTIRALARASRRQRTKLLEILDAACAERRDAGLQSDLVSLLEETGGLEDARRTARTLAGEARRSLDVLPPSPARDALRLLPEAALNRKA